MWSIVQKRRIHAHVAGEKSHIRGRTTTDGDSDVEAGRGEAEKPRALSLSSSSRSKSRSRSPSAAAGGSRSSHPYKNEVEKDGVPDDRFFVKLNGDDDLIDPKNWSRLARAKNIGLLCLLVFTQGWAGTASAQGNLQISQEFQVSQTAENLCTAMYLFGVGSGAMFAGPISETVGRNPMYLVATFCYLFFVLGTALTPTFAGQVVCKYFVGLFASATLAINGASVGDQFRPIKRTFVFPVLAWANVAGPTIAPIVGGWVVSNTRLGWRWTEYITLILSFAAWVLAMLFLPETYLPILLKWKATEMRRVTGDNRYRSEHKGPASVVSRLKEFLPLSVKFFATEPVVTVLGIYLILLYIILFTFQSGFDYIFKQTYGLPTGKVGSCFGAIALGESVAILAAPALYGWARHKTDHKSGASIEPEFRLWPAIFAAPLLPIALFWMGWTNYRSISVWSNIVACFFIGVVIVAVYASSYEFILDSYGDHAASALASITMLRYLVAGGMVMATRPMYQAMGVHWTMTFLGIISVLLVPMPWIFNRYGHKLRKRSKYAASEKKPVA